MDKKLKQKLQNLGFRSEVIKHFENGNLELVDGARIEDCDTDFTVFCCVISPEHGPVGMLINQTKVNPILRVEPKVSIIMLHFKSFKKIRMTNFKTMLALYGKSKA